MNLFSGLTMLGGLGLFLYGMQVLGDGLSKLSGGKLEQILEKLTSNRMKAVLLGAGVTAVIQSSSATTVMVVGFVNSGIMQLQQVVGIIMGANVGTTVTSWILSLTGIEGSNLFLQLLKPSSFSPVLAFVGVVMLMFSRSAKKKDIGTILIGFAILMFGMETMSSAVEPLAEVPEFTNILTMFSNPILGMLMGMVLTAIIQSSSASIGILQALCVTGAVNYATAVPIIMGQNIGTCITALLSSVGASKNARRAALVHLYFNLIGTVTFMIAFYGLNAYFQFAFLEQGANGVGVAVVHTLFNLFATVLLLPFAKGLEKLAYLTIQKTEDEETQGSELRILDERFLEQPSFAVSQCMEATVHMANLAREALFLAMEQAQDYSEEKQKQVLELEEIVDRYEDQLGSYLMKLSAKSLTHADSKAVSIMLHCISDFERISDHAVDVVYTVGKMKKKELRFSEEAKRELAILTRAIKEILDRTLEVFQEQDTAEAVHIEPLEEVIDEISTELSKRHIRRLREGICSIEQGFSLSDMINNYERVADHCSNIAVCLIQVEDDLFETHGYLNEVKHSDNEKFQRDLAGYRAKYSLP